MITIHHNFDERKFQWLWAKYVKAGNIENHCTACMKGPYSKKFSGASNHDLLSQPDMVMDEVPEGQYEAIYFCGVLRKGYLNRNLEKNNYRHNVHFAVRPQDGAHDVWDFEDWHVEIDGGVLEHIPATYELGDKFFNAPYDSHFYTCRIFRWMVGHFYPQELRDLRFGFPDTITIDWNDENDGTFPTVNLVKALIRCGYDYAEMLFFNAEGNDEVHPWREITDEPIDIDLEKRRNNILRKGLFNRKDFYPYVCDMYWMYLDGHVDIVDVNGDVVPLHMVRLIEDDSPFAYYNGLRDFYRTLFGIGANEFLDMIAPYQDRSEVI